MSDWEEHKFSDFVLMNPSVKFEKDSLVSFVEMKDLKDGIKHCVPSSKREIGGGARFQEKDTLFARITPCLENGKISQVKGLENEVGLGSTEFLVFRGKENISDTDFIYYLSRWSEVRAFAEKNLDGTSGRQRVPKDCFQQLLLTLPPLSEQKVIAFVLSSLDSKIDLLHRQNQTLDAIAETFFRQWFIEEAEESWEKGKLGDYMTIKHGYAFKGAFITPEETDKILVTPGNFKVGGGFSFHKFKYYTDNGFSESYILNEGDFIVTMTDLSVSNDSLGYPAFVPFIVDKFLLHNQRVGKVLIKKGDESKSLFLYYLMKTSDYRHYILGSCTGTNVSHTSPSIICEYEFNVPDDGKIISFKNQVQSLQIKQQSNIRQIQTLTQLRDNLLPKLMSGEVRVT